MAKKTENRIQFAALPYRIGKNGQPEVMLVSSRETHRWVIPKGWPIKGVKPRDVAAREAFEEAGLVGRILGKHAVGTFRYEKQLPKQRLLCEVRVFLFQVGRHTRLHLNFPHHHRSAFGRILASQLTAYRCGAAQITGVCNCPRRSCSLHSFPQPSAGTHSRVPQTCRAR